MLIHEPLNGPGDDARAKEVLCAVVATTTTVSDHWLSLLPPLEIVPTTRGFSEIQEVKDYFAEHKEQDDGDWDRVITFGLSYADGRTKLYVGGDRRWSRPKLFTGLFEYFAKSMWENSTSLRQWSYEQAEAIRFAGTDGEHLELFTSAFFKHSVDYQLLWEESSPMFFYFRRLDFLRRVGHIAPDPRALTTKVQ